MVLPLNIMQNKNIHGYQDSFNGKSLMRKRQKALMRRGQADEAVFIKTLLTLIITLNVIALFNTPPRNHNCVCKDTIKHK